MIAAMEEHEGVIQLLRAAGGITHPRVENFVDGELGSRTKVDRSNLRLEVALEVEFTASREAPRHALSEQMNDREYNMQIEDPAGEARRPGSSVNMNLTARTETRCSSPNSLPTRIPTSRGPPMALEFVRGRENTLKLLDILSKAKVKAKANGDVKLWQLSYRAKDWMVNPRMGKVGLKGRGGLPSAGFNDGNSDEEAEED